MSESKVITNSLHRAPDWLISFVEPYFESILPSDVLLIAANAYLDSPSSEWFDLVEQKATEHYLLEMDGEELGILAKELIEEMFVYLDPYLKTIIPEQSRIIASTQRLDCFHFAVTWDIGIIKW